MCTREDRGQLHLGPLCIPLDPLLFVSWCEFFGHENPRIKKMVCISVCSFYNKQCLSVH